MGASTEIDCHPSFWGGPKYTGKWNHGPLDMDMTPEIVLHPHDDGADIGLNFHSKCLFHRSWQSNGVPQLREASPDINIEVENVLASNYPFRFRCPVVLIRYLDTTSAREINRLRSIIVELSGCCKPCCNRRVPWRSWLKGCIEGWIAAIERLPTAIKLIKFEIGWTYLDVAQLEIVAKKTQRLAPNAKIKVSDLPVLRSNHREILHRSLRSIIDEIEDHSEDYKKWWRDSREKIKSQREEA